MRHRLANSNLQMYPRAKWGMRVCVYLSTTPIAGASGGWIAYGVAHVSNPSIKKLATSLHSWRSPHSRFRHPLYLNPPGPITRYHMADTSRPRCGGLAHDVRQQTHAWQALLVHNRQAADGTGWENIVVYMCQVTSTYNIATFTPIIVNTIGFDKAGLKLMVAPPCFVAFVVVFVVGIARPFEVVLLIIGDHLHCGGHRRLDARPLALRIQPRTPRCNLFEYGIFSGCDSVSGRYHGQLPRGHQEGNRNGAVPGLRVDWALPRGTCFQQRMHPSTKRHSGYCLPVLASRAQNQHT